MAASYGSSFTRRHRYLIIIAFLLFRRNISAKDKSKGLVDGGLTMPTKTRNVILAFLFVILFASPLVFRDEYVHFVLNNVAVIIILVRALNFILGFTGEVFLGTIAFFAVGCYSNALMTTRLGLNFWQALPPTVLITAALAFLLGLPTLKVMGFYLALMSTGFTVVVGDVLKTWSSLTNGVWGSPEYL